MAFGAVAAERGRAWRAAATGEARVIVGARSALFLPFRELGLIVVDEEHDAGFKQDDRVHYQARDMTVVRGNLGKFPVVLSSATPSIESHVNARTGRYRHVRAARAAIRAPQLPDVPPIDLRQHPPERGKWLSPVLVDAVTETLAAKQQTLLFLNRRGYAPLTLCRAAATASSARSARRGWSSTASAAACTATIAVSRCRIPEKCPKCGEPDRSLRAGPVWSASPRRWRSAFPKRASRCCRPTSCPGLTEMREIIRTIEAGGIDIVIGTQMVAKGHHFPQLATVGIVDGDLGLARAPTRARASARSSFCTR